MITKDINVKVKKDEVKLNTMLYAYEGDRGLEFQLTLENWKYFFSQALGVEEDQLIDCSARILLVDPNGEKMKLVDVPIEENEVKFKVNQNLTEKVGDYKVYVQIFKENGATVTCPPFVFTVKPLGDYTDIIPSDVGLIKVQEENLLAYNTISDYGIRTVSELPKVTEISDNDYVIIQQGDITNIITTADLFKKVISELKLYTDGKITEVTGNITSSLEEAKAYADSLIETLVGTAPDTLDTIYEIAQALQENEGVVESLTSQIAQKADKVHTHNATDIIEDETHKFVTDIEKTNWNDKYTKSEVDTKLEPKFDGVEVVEDKLKLKSGEAVKGEVQLPKGFSGSYNDLTDKPETFNPSEHTHTKDEITDLFQVINSLESDSETDALSAKQGKELKTKIVETLQSAKDYADTNKVQKEEGKQLSTNDYTNEDKQKLSSLQNYTLPIASSDVLGGIKIGDGLNIDENGTVNVVGGSGGVADSIEWEKILNKPERFPAESHTHNKSEIVDMIIVENQLESDSEIDALSAKQGKVLNEKIIQLQSKEHIHENKTELDKIIDGKVDNWDAKETIEGSQAKATKSLNDAKAYSDSKLVEGKSYTDTKLVEAKKYADSKVDYGTYRIEYNSVQDSLDFIYTPKQ